MNESEASESHRGRFASLPGWKKGLLAIALVLAALGGGLAGYNALAGGGEGDGERSAATRSAEPGDGSSRSVGPRGLAPTEDSGSGWPTLPSLPGRDGSRTGTPSDGSQSTAETEGGASPSAGDGAAGPRWPGALFRLGFGFIVGFSIGYATRTFLRIGLVVAGLMLLALFGLQYAGLISVDWSAMEGVFERGMAWLRTNTADFRGFITGQLPSAASGLGGLLIGLKK